MSFNKKILKLLKEKKKTKAQLAKASGIPYTTLDSMLKRDSDASKFVTIYKMAEFLDVPVEELVFDEDACERTRRSELNDDEKMLIDNYRSVDARAKESIFAMSNYEVTRQTKIELDLEKKKQEQVRKIPIYLSPAAAGLPMPILEDDYSIVKTSQAPDEANFGIKISGDSMEPIIADSSVVWVKQQDSLINGDIGIFVLNGESLCKKLDNIDGKCYLVSVNSLYSPIEVLETDNLRVVGKVLL